MKRRSNLAFLLALVLLPVCFHAQSGTPKISVQVDSSGLITNGDFRARADTFIQELSAEPDSRGLIVIYGSPPQVAARKRLINHHFRTRMFPLSRLDVKVGGNVSEFQTDFWLIPAGAKPPEIKPEAWIAGEFGLVYKTAADKGIKTFFEVSRKLPDHQAYVVNYGSPAQVAMREKWFTNNLSLRSRPPDRITLVNGGPGPVRTVMWLVPPGAKTPNP
jgi:hypothetical protein